MTPRILERCRQRCGIGGGHRPRDHEGAHPSGTLLPRYVTGQNHVAGGRPAGAHDETRPFVAHLVRFQSGTRDGLLKRHVVPRSAIAHEPPLPLVNRLVRIHTRLPLDATAEAPLGVVLRKDDAGASLAQ